MTVTIKQSLFSEYVHLTKAPTVSSDNYSTISVTLNFSAALMKGSGRPTLYQLQYRVST